MIQPPGGVRGYARDRVATAVSGLNRVRRVGLDPRARVTLTPWPALGFGLTGVPDLAEEAWPDRGQACHLGSACQPDRGDLSCPAGQPHQRCRVHFIRKVLAHVAKGEGEMVAAVFRTIFAQPDLESMAKQWDKVRDQLAARYPKIGALMDDAKAEV